MRNGLMVTENVFKEKNIGDYIQTIAARQFTPNPIFIQREKLRDYNGESVKAILNGWFMTNPEQFPPSEKITPLYVSFHMNPRASKGMLSEEGIAHLKKHAPIGCRDVQTMRNLQRHGIDAYFTGCLTLTLGRSYHRREASNGAILFVDPAFPHPVGFSRWVIAAIRVLPFMLFNFIKVCRLWKKLNNNYWFRQASAGGVYRKIVASALFLKTYGVYFDHEIICDAEYLSHMVPAIQFPSETSKISCADELLKKYSQARLVVTSRIHAALPCVSMGTPSIFVNVRSKVDASSVASGRLEGVVDYLNVLRINGDVDDGFEFDIGSKDRLIHENSQVVNKSNWQVMADDLAEKCFQFMKSK